MLKMGTFCRFKKVVEARASNALRDPTLMVFSPNTDFVTVVLM